jgi:hypothetical protein
MAISKALYPLFSHSVQIARRTSTTKWGKPGYATPTTYKAAIERSADLVRTENGREVVAKRKIFLWSQTWTTTNIPQPTDKLILPATHQGTTTNAQIIFSQLVSDERGIGHVVLWC